MRVGIKVTGSVRETKRYRIEFLLYTEMRLDFIDNRKRAKAFHSKVRRKLSYFTYFDWNIKF